MDLSLFASIHSKHWKKAIAQGVACCVAVV